MTKKQTNKKTKTHENSPTRTPYNRLKILRRTIRSVIFLCSVLRAVVKGNFGLLRTSFSQEVQKSQNTRELISARKTSHTYNARDPSRQRLLSPGIRVNTRYINSTRGTALNFRLWYRRDQNSNLKITDKKYKKAPLNLYQFSKLSFDVEVIPRRRNLV